MARRARKLTLRECIAQDCDGLLFYCNAVGCAHESQIAMDEAVIRFGVGARLDEIEARAVCTKCGGRQVDVRPRWPAVGPGGKRDV